MSNQPVPLHITQSVERYVTTQHSDVAKWTHRELLDNSGIYDLHALAASIYASGYADGISAQHARVYAERSREHDATHKPDPRKGH